MTASFEGFEEADGFTLEDVDVGEATIRVRHGGEGPPLLLLHGNPLTHVTWHKIAPRLAEEFTVVAADLRGYGDSSAPEPTENYDNYSFRAMADDQVRVMQHLGFERFFAAGHDRGARTVHRMCLDHPERVAAAGIVDILPSHHVWTNTSKHWATKSWHWLFMIQPPDFPERMMASVPPEWYMEKKIGKPGIGLAPFSDEAFSEYVRCFTDKTIRGSCNDYRATATVDFELDDADFGTKKIECPVVLVWGARSHTGSVWGDLVPIWSRYAEDVRGSAVDCGHYVQEEAPDPTYEHLREFFVPLADRIDV